MIIDRVFCKINDWSLGNEVYTPGWYFWCDNWEEVCGPFASEEEAREVLKNFQSK